MTANFTYFLTNHNSYLIELKVGAHDTHNLNF